MNRLKKYWCFLMVIVITVLACGVSYAAEQNLCRNPGFETGTSGWTATSASFEQTSEQSHSGSYSGKVNVTGTYGRAYYRYKFKKGVQYEVSAWVRMADENANAHLVFDHTVAGNGEPKWQELGYTEVFSDKWTLVTTSFIYNGTNKTGEAAVYIRIGDGTKKRTFYIDDVSIVSSETSNWRDTEYQENEMITNRGFDDEVSGWITKNAAIRRVVGEGYDHSEAAGLVQSEEGGYVGQKLTFEEGKEYAIGAYIKTDGSGAYFNINVQHSDQSVEMVKTLALNDGEWKLLSAKYVHRRKTEEVIVYFTTNNTAAWYLDDVSVIPTGRIISEETSYDNTDKPGCIYVDGKLLETETMIKDGIVLCDVQKLALATGGYTQIDGETVSVERGIGKMELKVGKRFVLHNGIVVTISTSPEVKSGCTYVPAEEVSKLLGCDTTQRNGTIYIETKTVPHLPSCIERIKRENKLDILILRGSNPQRSSTPDPYTEPMTKLLENMIKKNIVACDVTVRESNVSTTGAFLGAFRAVEEVRKKHADLLLVDLLPNDINVSVAEVKKNLESLVRSVKSQNDDIDIVFLLSLNEELAALYQNGKIPDVVKAYEEIAGIYNIPLLNAGKSLADSFKKDGKTYGDYHNAAKNPNTAGNSFYAKAIYDLIYRGLQNAVPKTEGLNRALTDCFMANVIYANEVPETVGWNFYDESLSESGVDGYIMTAMPKQELELTFEGNLIGVYYQSAQDSGDIMYSIDGGEYHKLSCFDEYSYKFEHMSAKLLADGLSDGSHKLKIMADSHKNENSKAHKIRISAFLVGKHK